MASKKNQYGQYMTPEIIADFMLSLADITFESSILEPCSGKGVFLDILTKKGYKNITSYEIDDNLIDKKFTTINESFISAKINGKFDLIIGNPPYIRWKNLETQLKIELEKNELWNQFCNSLCDYSAIFILKSVKLLKENGQLIFITPEYWLNNTHSKKLRNYILENGYLEEIYHFNETPIFDNVRVSIIIFKFIKSKNKNNRLLISKLHDNKKLNTDKLLNIKHKINQPNAEYIERLGFKKDEKWILASNSTILDLKNFEKKCTKKINNNLFCDEFYTIGEFCDIGNGMVSGLDKAFQINTDKLTKNERKYLISVVKAKDLERFYYKNITNYFLIKEGEIKDEASFIKEFPNIFNSIKHYVSKLDERYKYNRKINFWEWVFLRNYNLFNTETMRIFVPCKERISNKDYFRFALVEKKIYPTQDVTAIFPKKETEEDIHYILSFLNSRAVFNWLRYNGTVKGSIIEFSEKPISSIPYRKIDFSNQEERAIHDNIVKYTKEYISSKDEGIFDKIYVEFDKLF